MTPVNIKVTVPDNAGMSYDDKQEMVVVVGYPGSGKTSMCQHHLASHTWINRCALLHSALSHAWGVWCD